MSDFVINYGEDIFETTIEALENSNLKELVKKTMKVSIKPNMVLSKPPSSGATTHKEVVEAIIVYLKELGVQKIKIIESAWIGDDTKKVYKVCGYYELAEKYDIEILDLKQDETTTIKVLDMEIPVCNEAIQTDFLINVPVLKAHCQTSLTCNLKNLKGCIPDSEKRRFHSLGLHKPIAYLNKAIKTHFCVVDGICGDLTFEEGGNPVIRNMIMVGEDPLLIDSYCANLIGYEINEINYLTIADKIGVGEIFSEKTKVLELNGHKKPKQKIIPSTVAKKLSSYIDEKDACSACYSALIYALNKTDKRSFKNLKIKIGQGYKNQPCQGVGVGNCTKLCDKNILGCPPRANKIVEFLENL